MSKPLEFLQFMHFTLDPKSEMLDHIIAQASQENPWFSHSDYSKAIANIRDNLLEQKSLISLQSKYPSGSIAKRIGLVVAGNIPLVGMHDVVCTILAGHHLVLKLSDKDSRVFTYLFQQLHEHFPETVGQFKIVERLKEFDAVIATGSNNSSRYFEYYFGKYPHIIRKNRNGVAVLTGDETEQDLLDLGNDIYQYYGLGCRNVAKVYVPTGYDFVPLLEQLKTYGVIIDHPKYKNNYDYNLALTILNNRAYMTNESLLLLEDDQFASRIATLHYQTYDAPDTLVNHLEENKEYIQCVVSKQKVASFPFIPFGKAQAPGLTDFADGVDTMQFLTAL